MQNRLSYVDGLRAIAVLSVMVFHARVHAPGVDLEWWAKECSHGVDLFFVVSGFCLALPTLEKLHTNGYATFDAVAFALKRFLRIFPPYALAVVIAAAVGAALLAHGIAPPGGMPSSFDASDVMSQLLFIDRDHVLLNRSFWSLAVEFRWYFIFPFALLLAARNMRAFITVTLLVAFASELTRATSTDLGVLPAFLFGVAAAYVRAYRHPIARYAVPLGLLSVGVAFLNESRPHFPIQTNVGWHLAAFFFVIWAGAQNAVQRVLSNPLLVRVGIASYSIYLVHEPIIAATMALLRPRYGDAGATPVALGIGLAAGFALWAVVERPLTRQETVAAFVANGRSRMTELFALAGVPNGFGLGEQPAAAPSNLIPLQKKAV